MFSFKFSSLLGTVYRKGNLVFANDGNVVISPVGNRISLFDLKNNKSQTLPIENRYNITCLALDARGNNLIAVNEDGEAVFINLNRQVVTIKRRFNKRIRAIQFSPDGKYFALTKDKFVTIFKTPNVETRDKDFIMHKVFKGFFEDTVCLDWTSDSRILAVGSKDMTTRLFAVEKFVNFPVCFTLGGHSDSIKGCFFKKNSLDIYTVSRNGQVCVWTCNIGFDGLMSKSRLENHEEVEIEPKENTKIEYKKATRHYLGDLVRAKGSKIYLTAVDYSKETNILVSGFTNGAFFLHEMPDANLIHSLSIEDQLISSIAINKSGDWIALACPALGQLVVWEWQSESYIMKQQGHVNSMTCLAYSPNGLRLATGGDDSKVKLWDTDSGFCFKTFSEHTASVTGLKFSKNGKFIVSSSLDGTVRAFDFERYRNFRTFMNETKITQFSCIAIDSSSEFVCAGAQDSFEVFVWSIKTGRLLEILSGHSGPVSSLSFSPTQIVLASGSWDKTVRFWDVFENKETREIINMTSDVLAVEYRPDGKELAVATLDANITFFDIPSLEQTGSVEGRFDLGSGRRDTDLVTPKTIVKGKAFTSICYSADGENILAAGQSKNVCIYNCKGKLLTAKFEISQNHSFDGMEDYISKRKMTPQGNMDLIEKRDDEDDESPHSLNLPGAKRGDMASRTFKPEVRVTGITFSPTGRSWAATTTEGLLMYSLDQSRIFNPFELEIDITPNNIRQQLAAEEYSVALTQALRLNERDLIIEVIEKITKDKIPFVTKSLDLKYVDRFLNFLALYVQTTRHFGLAMKWISSMFTAHTLALSSKPITKSATNILLLKNLTVKYNFYREVCDYNKYTMQFLIQQGKLKRERREAEAEAMNESTSNDVITPLVEFSKFEKLLHEVESHDFESVIVELMQMSSSSIVGEIHCLESRDSSSKFLQIMTVALASDMVFHVVQTYLGVYLKIHWESIIEHVAEDDEFLQIFQTLWIAQKEPWEKLQAEFQRSLCAIKFIINPALF